MVIMMSGVASTNVVWGQSGWDWGGIVMMIEHGNNILFPKPFSLWGG